MILLGMGANLPSPQYGPPKTTLEAALSALGRKSVGIVSRSRWYRSAAVPPSDQPPFVNGVAAIDTGLDPVVLLQLLHTLEARFGRVRSDRWAARVIDLDLLAYGDVVRPSNGSHGSPELPHPRLPERAFVLVPLAEIAPDWRHPVSGLRAAEMLARLAEGQSVEML